MSSWTALTWHKMIETAFKTKTVKCESFGIFIMKILDFKSDEEYVCIFKEIMRKTSRNS